MTRLKQLENENRRLEKVYVGERIRDETGNQAMGNQIRNPDCSGL
ncbi:hypothetical protein [Marinobacter sp.]|nr:hypothetical protein [Marinobacter sp.]HKK57350.1 hypothetical protein [Marinobacter sp.]